MALTLTEASKLSNDTLLTGVIETITQESGILNRLPFITVLGNGLTYNRQNAAPSVDFYSVGDTWQESTPTFTQHTATLRILGGDADIDNFLKRTRSNVQDLEAEVLALKAKAWRDRFEDTFVNGDQTVDPNAFDGLNRLLAPEQTIPSGPNGAALTLDKLDELIDAIRPGKPDLLMMSRRSRRGLNKLARNTGTFLETDRDEFGMFMQYYDGIPIVINDWISDEQTVGSNDDCSTIYAIKLTPGEGLNGLASAPADGSSATIIEVDEVGDLETKDATRYRVKGYVGLALFRTTCLAALTGVRPV